MADTKRVSGAWQVEAGLIPGQPMPEYTKLFAYTTEMREGDEALMKDQSNGFPYATLNNYCRLQAEAMAYWRQLNDPGILNWARIDWIWF